jgi:hypothetical protein
MPLTLLTVTAGTQGWVLPDGSLAQGAVHFQPVAEAAGGGYIIAAASIPLPVMDGAFPAGRDQLASNAQAAGLAYLVTERITNARNPTPYVVVPSGSTLDLSTAARAVPGVVSLPYVQASTLGQPDGVATLGGDGLLTAAQRPASSGGGVDTITAADATIVVAGTASNPTLAVGVGIPESAVTDLAADLAARALAVDLAAETARAETVEASKADAAATTAALAAKAAQTDLAAEVTRAETAEAGKAAARARQTPAFTTPLTVDATQGLDVEVTLTGNLTLASPTGLVDRQVLQLTLTQDATGGRTMTFAGGSIFNNPGAAITLSTAAGKRDRLLCAYHGPSGKLDVLAFQAGY